MRAANTAVKRVRHAIPTVKDISIDLNGATVFSKLDLAQAYHQLELSPSSRLNFGTSSASEIFQHTLQLALQGLNGVKNIADDIIIFGKDVNEHNENLNASRIERWMLRLQQYDFEVVYKSGIGNPADYLSRHPTSAEYKKQNIADEYVNFVTQEAVFPALSLGEIKAATDKDTTLRITPHTTTKVPPAQLLYNRPVIGKLPMLPRKLKNINRHREARENDQLRKGNAMNYANKRRNTKECDIKVGDLVICVQKKTNKFSSRFNVQPYKVVRVHGSKVVARHGDHFISRNSSFFKKVQQRLDGNIAAAADDDDNVEYHKRATEEIPVRRSARSRIQTQFYGDPINSRLIR
eukprot:gene7362-13097_t